MLDTAPRTVEIGYGRQRIPVLLSFAERDRLTISVHPDGSVTALAPLDRPLPRVLAHLERKGSWIAKQRRHFAVWQPLPEEKRYVSGETHLYLGRQYRLKVRRAAEAEVKLIGRYLNVSLPSSRDPAAVRNALGGWYRAHAEPIYRDRMERAMDMAPALRRTNPPLKVRCMRSRWGSCSKSGAITLSSELIKAPLHCIEYVIVHELCHLSVHDHSPAFFRLLSRCMPDWERRKERLNSFVLR